MGARSISSRTMVDGRSGNLNPGCRSRCQQHLEEQVCPVTVQHSDGVFEETGRSNLSLLVVVPLHSMSSWTGWTGGQRGTRIGGWCFKTAKMSCRLQPPNQRIRDPVLERSSVNQSSVDPVTRYQYLFSWTEPREAAGPTSHRGRTAPEIGASHHHQIHSGGPCDHRGSSPKEKSRLDLQRPLLTGKKKEIVLDASHPTGVHCISIKHRHPTHGQTVQYWVLTVTYTR